jgi:hypothetical protein
MNLSDTKIIKQDSEAACGLAVGLESLPDRTGLDYLH